MSEIRAIYVILVHKTAGHGIVGIARQLRHKSPICEELHSENFMLKFLTWENAWGEFAYPLIRLRMAHISAISVHDFANSGKKLARAAPILMWGRGGSGRIARHRAYTWEHG